MLLRTDKEIFQFDFEFPLYEEMRWKRRLPVTADVFASE
jgi:hypothetical protein